MSPVRRVVALTGALAAATALTACGGSSSTTASPGPAGSSAAASSSAPGSASASPASFADVLAKAKGQTVNWYMYGGDDKINGFVNGYLKGRLSAQGVTLNQVKITDTVTAVDKVLAEKQAGASSGSVDAIWINGENFATGKQANAWYCGYDRALPNAQYVDFSKPAIANDFGLPVDGCESVWQQANSALVYDSKALGPNDVKSVSALFAWAKGHPGRFTYPAPPDFTGSMAVRTFFYDTNGGLGGFAGAFNAGTYAPAATKLWKRLNALAPSLYKKGATYPAGEPDVEKLYANGEVSAFLTYAPGEIGTSVSKGLFPRSTREAVFDIGNISNYSFLSIPANSPHKEGAQVLANTLLDPATQLEFYKETGTFPAVDLAKVPAALRAAFAAVGASPSVLPLTALTKNAQPELTSTYVTTIEKDWKTNVQQK